MVIIDTGPDFREQALRTRLSHIDSVLYTHSHADHIMGLDDLRPLSFASFRAGGPIPPLFRSPHRGSAGDAFSITTFLRVHLSYARAGAPGGACRPRPRPRGRIHPGAGETRRDGHGRLSFRRRRLPHGCERNPESSFALLTGLQTLVLPSLRHHPHPSHATVKQAVEWAERIGARQTWLTHIAHELGHEATNRILPPGVALAYDGLEVAVNL